MNAFIEIKVTVPETVKVFEKTPIEDFSSINTCLAFDSQILLPKNQRDQLKLIYKKLKQHQADMKTKEYQQKF